MAQTSKLQPKIEVSGFVDAYYVYDFNHPKNEYRQTFLYNHNRHNEFNANLGFIKASAQHQKYRANIAIQAGTYVNDNYANEPAILKNLFEANAGLSLNKKNNLWLDAGIFASHIGFESAISLDNLTLTRSLLAENSPYYLSGAKLTYTPNKKVEIAALACNGWQRIQRVKGNSLPSFGTQLKIMPSNKVTINWSTFIGTDDPDSTRRMRYFNNIYTQVEASKKIKLIAGFDIGTQQKIKNSLQYNLWYSPVIITQYTINKHLKTAIRGEYYHDATGIIIPSNTANGFKTKGLSINLDYAPAENIAARLEARILHSKDKIFENQTTPTDKNFILAGSLAVKFAELVNNNDKTSSQKP